MKHSIDTLKKTWFLSTKTLLFIFITSFAFGQVPPPEVKQARTALEADQPKKAIETLKKATATYPTDATIWYQLGLAQMAAGQRKEAEISFQTGIEKNDKEPLNYVGKGHLRITDNQVAEARKLFDQVLATTKSKNAPALNAIARALLTDPKFAAEALGHLQKSKALDKSNPETALLLGDAYLAQNNGGQAVSSYENAASLDPKWGTPHYKIGLVYIRSKNNSAAEEAFLKATQVDANYTLAYKELGELYYQMGTGKAEAAVTNYAKYLALTENPEPGQLRYAFFLFMAKKYNEANEIFKKLVAKPEVTVLTLRYYAYSLYQAGKYDECKTIFDQYFAKAKPEEIEAGDYIYYGELLVKLKQDSLAIDAYRNAVKLDKTLVKIQEQVAEMLYASKRRYPETIDAYQTLISMRQNQKATSKDLFSLGRSYYFDKQFEKADTTFGKLIELQPNMTVGDLWQGRARANLDPESTAGLAKPNYEKVIEKANPEKGKADLVEAHSYMGYYYYVVGNLDASLAAWKKVLEIEAGNVKATEAIKAINNIKNPPPPKKANNK